MPFCMIRIRSARLYLFIALGIFPQLVSASGRTLSEGDIEARLREPIPPATDAASEKIIEAHLRALGGLGRVMAIQNTVSQGTLREAKEESRITYYRAAPNLMRTESVKQQHGRTAEVIRGYNGERAWLFDKSERHPFPTTMNEPEARSFILQADFHGPIINREAQGNIFRYEGEVRSRGRKHYLLKMFDPNGRTTYLYFDAETMLVTRTGRQESLHGSIVDFDTYYTRYQRVDGVWMPSEIEMAIGNQVYGTLKWNSIQANQSLNPEIFEEPKVREVWLRQQR